MKKHFLFFSYSWVDNANFYFKKIEESGYLCDFVYENNLHEFRPIHNYENIVLYLHEPNTIPITNYIIDTFYRFSNLIQHDDTDFEDIQVWSNKKPDLILHREYTYNSKNPWGALVYPFHFPVESKYIPGKVKDYDVSFIGRMTSSRRAPFVNHIKNLSKTTMRDLKWHIDVDPIVGIKDKITSEFSDVINRSKIGLNYFGNSYESKRTWELASVGAAILSPRMRTKTVNESQYMPFEEYLIFKDDFSDLEEKIRFLLSDQRYLEYGNKAKNAFDTAHNPQKCFEYYFNIIKTHNLI